MEITVTDQNAEMRGLRVVLEDYAEEVSTGDGFLESRSHELDARRRFVWCASGSVLAEDYEDESQWAELVTPTGAAAILDLVAGRRVCVVPVDSVGFAPICGRFESWLCIGHGVHHMFYELPLETTWILQPVHPCAVWTSEQRYGGKWYYRNLPSLRPSCSRQLFPVLKMRGRGADGETTHPFRKRSIMELPFVSRFSARALREPGSDGFVEVENYRGEVVTLRCSEGGATVVRSSPDSEAGSPLPNDAVADFLAEFAVGRALQE